MEAATAALEVETSLWQVKRATVPLSFTVKEEDLGPLRNWVRANRPPLYIVQVFYDQAYVLPFSKLEFLIGPDAPAERRVAAVGSMDQEAHLQHSARRRDAPRRDPRARRGGPGFQSAERASDGLWSAYGVAH